MRTDPCPTPRARGALTNTPAAHRSTLGARTLALLGCLAALLLSLGLATTASAGGTGGAGTASPAAGDRPIATASAAPADGSGPVATAASTRFGAAVLAELNRIRARSGLPSVSLDVRMSRTAAAHSRDMARHGYFSHGAWSSRVARAAGSARDLGETLGWLSHARPRSEARRIVRGWLHSPPHREVLLDGRFRRVGIGRAGGRLGGTNAAIYTVDWASAR